MARIDRNELLAKVQELLEPHKGGRQLASYPDSVAEFKAKYLKSKHGAWVVGYAGSQIALADEATRARLLAVDISVISRKLSSDTGALSDVELIDEELDGARFMLSGVAYEIEYQSDSFLDEVDSVWYYKVRLVAFPL
ncbi:MAG: Gp37 family protein [Bacteroidota bacterium]